MNFKSNWDCNNEQIRTACRLYNIELTDIARLESNMSGWRVSRELQHKDWFINLEEAVGNDFAEWQVESIYKMLEFIRNDREKLKPKERKSRREGHLTNVRRKSHQQFDEISGREYRVITDVAFGRRSPDVLIDRDTLHFRLKADWGRKTEGLPVTWIQGGHKKWVIDCELVENHMLSRENDVKVYKATVFGKRTEAQIQKQIDLINREFAECDDPEYSDDLRREAVELREIMNRMSLHIHTMWLVQSQSSNYAETGEKISALADSAQAAVKLIDRRARDEFVRQLDV